MTFIAHGLRVLASVVVGCRLLAAAAQPASIPRETFEQWLEPGRVTELELVLSPAAVDALQTNPRKDQSAQVWIKGALLGEVRLHLKGRGSFQPLSAKPNLTLIVEDADPTTPSHGLCWKLHLQNSSEDPSLLNEWLGSAMARASRLPAPRVAHARVRLNRRDLGVYVVREGFSASLLKRARGSAPRDGTFWEPLDGADVDGRFQPHALEPRERSSITAVHPRTLAVAACEPDLHMRWNQLSKRLDVDAFARLLALEVLLGHWDGYGLRHNNYRLWQEAGAGRFQMIPIGMDQLLAHPELTSNPTMNGLLARSFLETPSGRQSYQEAFEELRVRAFDPLKLTGLVREQAQRIEPGMDRAAREEFRAAVKVLCERIAARAASLEQQRSAATPPPAPMTLQPNTATPLTTVWRPALGSEATGRLSRRSLNGGDAIGIEVQRPGVAAWETRVHLGPGRYAIEARARVQDLVPLKFGRNQGARLRVAGLAVSSAALGASEGWQPVRCEFDASETTPVGLLWELRAERGEAWLDLDSIQVKLLSARPVPPGAPANVSPR